MEDKRYVTLISVRNKTFLFFFLAGATFMFLLSFLPYITSAGNREHLPPQLISRILLGLFGLFIIYKIVIVDTLKVYSDKLEIVSILGEVRNVIYRNDIVSWDEVVVKTSRWFSYKWIVLQTKDSKYEIQEIYYENYPALKNVITNGITKGGESQSDFDKRRGRFDTIVIVIGIVLLLSIVIIKMLNR